MEDYETGLHRGRGTRHTLGRMRWLLIASLFGNILLFYKAWDYSSQVYELETSNEHIRNTLLEKNVKEAKSEDFITALHKEKEKCNSNMLETKGQLSDCAMARKACAESLDATSSKMMENADILHKLEHEKETVDTLLEKCRDDLVASKELTIKLKTDVDELNKKESASEKQIDPLANGSKSTETIQEIKAPEVDKSVKKDLEVEKEKVGEMADPQVEVPGLLSFATCLFNEDLKQQKCVYRNDPDAPSWKLGHAEFLDGNSDQDEKDILSIYVDDSMLSAQNSAGIVFDAFKTNRCVEVVITFLVTDSASIIVEDSDQSVELVTDHSKGWRTENFIFKQSSSHLVKITGKVQAKGGAAIASISLAEAECSDAGKTGDDPVAKDDAAAYNEELEQIVT